MKENNKAYLKEKLMENSGLTEEQVLVVLDVLDDHFIVGHNNKDKIKADFMERLEMDEEKADELYNICAGSIVEGIFNK